MRTRKPAPGRKPLKPRPLRQAGASTVSAFLVRRRANAAPIPAGFDGIAEPDHPPGFYGPPDGLIAVNALGPKETLAAADYSGFGIIDEPLRETGPVDLKPWLLAAAFLLFAADTLVSLWLSGSLRGRAGRAAACFVLIAVGSAMLVPARTAAEPAATESVSPRD